MRVTRGYRIRWSRLWPLAAGLLAVGCLPDNVIRSVLGENLTQSFGIQFGAGVNFLLGIPDVILNTIALGLFSALTGS